MRTFSTVEGLPVIEQGTGIEWGYVIDLLVGQDMQIEGFVVDKKGWFNHHMFLPVQAVASFGSDGVMISEHLKLSRFISKEHQAYPLKLGKKRLGGRSLLTSEGEKVGLVEDVYFDEEVGTIVGYEVTDGLVADLVEGRKVILPKGPLVISKDNAIVSI
ncbi:PRC-barrel domain-containing protein [Bacillus sp. FJAT-45037]|uniref:PRC-barrel domain-containing protein n=1 Tax=Bacillus sp. FJAT-45037 TaxID=2011007 RepID=UPI000C23D603|nr:PRC-barrel domain-containing protein [Bacillus sp. FJAT-45037]